MATYKEKVKKALDLIDELDQLVRVLSDEYEEWINSYQDGEKGPETYEWDTGIAP